MESKTCTCCEATKPAINEFFSIRNRALKSGEVKQYLRSACIPCELETARKKMRASRASAPNVHKARRRAYRATPVGKEKKKNNERDRRARRAGFNSHADRIANAERAIAIKNIAKTLKKLARKIEIEQNRKPWNATGLSEAQQWRTRYRLDPEFALKERMRNQLKKKQKRSGIGDTMRAAINRNGRSNAVEAALGYTIAELRAHLEKQFIGGMNWQRFHAGEIHIDHITPQADFDLQNDDEWRACWALGNLRPMLGADNLAKSAEKHFLL